MKHFLKLFEQLEQTNKTKQKLKSLKQFFSEASDMDKIWAIALFSGRRPKSPVNSKQIRAWAIEASNLPAWLFEESYHVTGDLAETIAHLVSGTGADISVSLSEWMEFLIHLHDLTEEEKKMELLSAWNSLSKQESFVFNKLLTGAFRIGVSQNLVVRALAETTNISPPVIAHRIMGNWNPGSVSFKTLLFEENQTDNFSKPYPFYLAHPLEPDVSSLGEPEEWTAEWKWDGIRAQIIKRGGNLFVWSRGEELVTGKFPEFEELIRALPEGIVLDGEILPYKDGAILPFNVLQTRIGRKNLNSRILSEAPVVFYGYDLLEYKGKDWRQYPLTERRKVLKEVIQNARIDCLLFSDSVNFITWQQLSELRKASRSNKAEGIMLKRKSSPYLTGRKRGDWWKWKVDPLSVDAVLIYAQKGHGKRADLYTDYTLGVWDRDKLVSFAKAYSGLTDEEIREVDSFVKKNTLEKFGPVRTVKPELVFEIGFEGIQQSGRHKCGIAVRFPRILRWRRDKKAEEADSLNSLKSLLNIFASQYGG